MITHKMHRAEAEVMVACAAAAVTASSSGDFLSKLGGMFAKQYDPCIEKQNNGKIKGYTTTAKKAVDLLVEAGLVDDDGQGVGAVYEPVF